MKRIAASVGLVALGTSALQAVDAGALSAMQTSKPWSASVSLRGFYDDNINSTRNDKKSSVGFEVNPSVGLAKAWDATSASIAYTYSGKYYENRPEGNTSNWDHTHIFDAALQHAFSSRVRVNVSDSFVVGQEPDVNRFEGDSIVPQRISGENIRNFGAVNLNVQATDLLGFELGYANRWYDYADEGGTAAQPSRSALLDRVEHAVHLDSRWHLAPQTTGILGYMYGQTDYIGDEPVVVGQMSDSRNSRSHFIYGGVEHAFSADLSGSLRAGMQFIDFYNGGTTSLSPYVEASMRYFYATESRLEVGVSHRRSSTDFAGYSTVVTDADTTMAYVSVTQRILPRLFGSAIGTFQYQSFNGGGVSALNEKANNQSDRFFLLGLDLSYRFNEHFSAHTGYNLDYLESDVSSRNYSRNRIYVGVTAEY